MKELTIEEKAKAYDEALKRAKDVLDDGTISNNTTVYLKDIFPELVELEDEKIRKELIKFIQKRNRSGCDYDYDKWIEWVEKQGGQKKWKPSNEQIDALEHFVRSMGESGYTSPYDNDTKLIYSLLEQLKQL